MDDIDRILQNRTAVGTYAMLGWVDPQGGWWLGPLGTPPPDPDQAVPEAWIPITPRSRRDEMPEVQP